jgi:predicted MFS family arabinose efflux permease
MDTKNHHLVKNPKRVLILPTVVLTAFLGASSLVFTSTLIPDIAKSFQVSIGTASTLSLVTGIVGLILGLAMGALTIRFKHKLLFILGIVFFTVGTLGFYFAPTFPIAILVYTLIGLGVGMIQIMSISLIGALFPLEKRGTTMGLMISMVFVSFILGAPLFGKIAELSSWRSVLIWFSLPVALACLILSLLVIPSNPTRGPPPSKSEYSEAFKHILLNKSAVACLAGMLLFTLFNTIPVYAVAFYRENFFVSPSTGGIFSAIASVGGLFGAIAGGALTNRLGRKSLTVGGLFLAGFFIILVTAVPNVMLSVAFWTVSATFAALTLGTFNNLVLEQVPTYRASMVSVSHTFGTTGSILGVATGGLVLNLYANNYQVLMSIFGISGIAAAIILLLLAKDPCKKSNTIINI